MPVEAAFLPPLCLLKTTTAPKTLQFCAAGVNHGERTAQPDVSRPEGGRSIMKTRMARRRREPARHHGIVSGPPRRECGHRVGTGA